jgi:hypothetical protein
LRCGGALCIWGGDLVQDKMVSKCLIGD